jgi:hypothetical protein
MNTHPTIVHAAADLRRQALLGEALDDGRTKPASVRRMDKNPWTICRCTIAWLATILSRVIDDFEPRPGPRPRRSLRRT